MVVVAVVVTAFERGAVCNICSSTLMKNVGIVMFVVVVLAM